MSNKGVYKEALDILWVFIQENDLENRLKVGKFSYWWFFHYDAYYWLVNYLKYGGYRTNSYPAKVILKEMINRLWKIPKFVLLGKKFDRIKDVDILCISNRTSWQYISDGKSFFWDDAQLFLEQRELRSQNKKLTTIEISTPEFTIREDKFERYSFELFRIIHKGGKTDFIIKDQVSEVRNELAKYISSRISNKLKIIKKSVLLAESIIKKLKPKSILITDENGSARIFTVAAGNLNVRTVGIQHGIIHDYHPLYVYPKSAKYVPLVDKMSVFGEFTKEVLVNKSIYDSKSIFVTGQLRTDIVKNFKKTKLLESLPLPKKSEFILLISSQNSRNYIKEFFKNIEKVKKTKRNSFIIVKLHPLESEDDFYDFIGYKYAGDVYVTKNTDLYSLLAIADVVVGTFSTVLAEANIFRKPIIVLNIPGFPDFFNFKDSKVAQFVDTPEQLNKKLLLKEIIQNKSNIDEFVTKHFYNVDGKVSKRVASLLQ